MKLIEEDSHSDNPPAGAQQAHHLDSEAIIANAEAEIRRQGKVDRKMMFIPTALVFIITISLTFVVQSQWFAANMLMFARPKVFVPVLLVCLVPVFTILYFISRRHVHKTRDAARLLATLDAPEAVSPLIGMLGGQFGSAPYDIATEALTRLLSLPNVCEAIEPSPSRRSILHLYLKDAQHVHLRTGDAPLARLFGLRKARYDKAIAFRIAILKSWRYYGGQEELKVIQSICKWKYKTFTCAALKDVALEVLPFVEERATKQSQTDELLRPAYKIETASELLIPMEGNKQQSNGALLRSVENLVSEGAIDKVVRKYVEVQQE
jgi:hypothetical protein